VLLTLDEAFGALGTQDASRFLAERDVYAPSGSFYAIEASRRLGLGDFGGLRIGLAPYTSTDDVERLLTGLELFLKRAPHRD
jgi:selenocysteine lyase/cysteine desulfurase